MARLDLSHCTASRTSSRAKDGLKMGSMEVVHTRKRACNISGAARWQSAGQRRWLASEPESSSKTGDRRDPLMRDQRLVKAISMA